METGGDSSQAHNNPLRYPRVPQVFEQSNWQPANHDLQNFRKHWVSATADDSLSLFGFRRFRTTQLLNLRFLEDEIEDLDHKIFGAGLKLGIPPTTRDKLGLKHARGEIGAPRSEDVVTSMAIIRLRGLLKEYNEALLSFNQIMSMETFALADSNWLSSQRSDFDVYETYKTRLLRVDLAPRASRDPFRQVLHRYLRAAWFYFRSKQNRSQKQDQQQQGTFHKRVGRNLMREYQNTIMLADILARFFIALLSGVLLVIPLAILAYQSSRKAHLLTVSTCIVVFSLLISLGSKASNQETLAASAAYAAVLVVFVAGTS